MKNDFIGKRYDKERDKLETLLKKIDRYFDSINNEELGSIIKNLLTNINEPFLFVVVGEVKAGKSSFINALLHSDVCKVDIDVCTDVVQQLVYSEGSYEHIISEFSKKIGVNSDILKKISIVDTPGTNSIIENHQVITENFIPNSDLIFFVFSATNPHTKSAWELLKFVKKEWKKRVVFILQKADFLSTEELSVNINKVKEYAIERGIKEPIVFPTSAKKELENRDDYTSNDSGFKEIKTFIEDNVTGDQYYKLKLLSTISSVEQIILKNSKDIDLYQKQIDIYKETTDKIKSSLDLNENQSGYEIDSLIKRLVGSYDKVASEFKKDLKEVLTFSKFLKVAIPFNKGNSIKLELNNLEKEFQRRVKEGFKLEASEGARYFIDGIRQLLESFLTDLNRLKDLIKDDQFSSKIPDNRDKVLKDVSKKLEELLENNSFIKSLENSSPENLTPKFLTESAMAIIGGIILTSTKVAILDVTGGILTTLGILVSSGVLLFKRNKIIKQFEDEIDKAKIEFEKTITEKLKSKFEIIYKTIDKSFIELYNYVEENEKSKLPLISLSKEIEKEAKLIFKEIKKSF